MALPWRTYSTTMAEIVVIKNQAHLLNVFYRLDVFKCNVEQH